MLTEVLGKQLAPGSLMHVGGGREHAVEVEEHGVDAFEIDHGSSVGRLGCDGRGRDATGWGGRFGGPRFGVAVSAGAEATHQQKQ